SNYYLYAPTWPEKESWYFALWNASRPSTVELMNVPFDYAGWRRLQQLVRGDERQLYSQWLNALIGRIFLGVHKSKQMRAQMIRKIRTKITRVKRPSFVSEIKVRDLDVGNAAPMITHPKVLSLSDNGELTLELYIHYEGGFSVELETIATISVSQRIRTFQVPIALAANLRRLTGKLLVRIGAPPSNRIWIGFFEMPHIDLKIEPIVSDREIKFEFVLTAIKKKLLDMIQETMVLPNMDDVTFFPSFGTGGIFE
ncbi:hypothetical protein GQ42DRAFT_103886, partial [Ramicandelaber brevisporus]